jgi:uncharacterized glyoxalase superfamily protein PhnB
MLTNRSAPPGTVTPVLFYPDVRGAVAWLEQAFGFEERVRIGEGHRSQMRVGEDGSSWSPTFGGTTWLPAAAS